jgi:hypothetical protein
MPDKEDRPPGHLGAAMQPPCSGEIEPVGIAVEFE